MDKMDKYERLDYADRWLADSFRVLQENPPGFAVWLEVEMTAVRALIDRLRQVGVRVSYTAVLVRAAGLALVRNPELHQLLAGTRRLRPARVDIGLSVGNEAAAAPVMQLLDVPGKPLLELAAEIERRAPEVRAEDTRTLAKLRRWGFLIPTGWLRRLILRALFSSLRFRKLFGSLQITVLPSVDIVASGVCGTTAVLAMGRVAERVVAREGRPAVRLMATLCCTGDHKVWDGQRVGRLLGEIARILESDELAREVPSHQAEVATHLPLERAG
jgi:pyruvate dehydrogenase E2 component (dihydrolipoamide acetyltransferase)/2-oxoglutarate dehydrogenase E2 component (dihydrolipoamide succinyltransferase)